MQRRQCFPIMGDRCVVLCIGGDEPCLRRGILPMEAYYVAVSDDDAAADRCRGLALLLFYS